MNDLVSICIPACNRPEMLAEALESCLLQDYAPIEIIIGDDSSDARSEAVVASFAERRDWEIAYRRNVPPLGQNENVNDVFDRARGDRVVLLHDDDRLLPGALSALASPWAGHPDLVASFGRQTIVSAAGIRDERATRELNEEFLRTGTSRLVEDPIRAALLQQFPNDAYMIRRDAATTVRYRSKKEIGNHCDVDFAIRVCDLVAKRNASQGVFYVDALVADYRRHDASISNSVGNRRPPSAAAGRALFQTVSALQLSAEQEPARMALYRRFIDRVFKGFALNGHRLEALRLFFSSAYGWRRRLTPKAAYHLALVVAPGIDRFRRYG